MNITLKLSDTDKEKRRAPRRKYREDNREKVLAADRSQKAKWRKNNIEKCRAYNNEWRKANPDKVRRTELKSNYGLSLEDFDRMVEAQGSRCAICKDSDPGGKGQWHVDHSHATGVVRGLLCQHCNLMLGHARDSTASLSSAISYLEKSHGQEETPQR